MAANVYGRVSRVTASLGIGRQGRDMEREERILRHLISASAWVEGPRQCGRSFAATIATRRYTGDGSSSLLVEDLISVTSLTENGTALVADTDYWLEPANRSPRWELVRNGAWSTTRRAVVVAGVWGYSYDLEATGAQLAADISAVATTLTVDAENDIEAGETLVTGSEQIYVPQKLDAVTIAIERGINGTTAAAHVSGTALSRRVYPAPVMEAVEVEASRTLREASGAFAGKVGGEPLSGGGSFGQEYALIMSRLAPYRLQAVR